MVRLASACRVAQTHGRELAATLVEIFIIASSMVYVWAGSMPSLLVWEAITIAYLAIGFARLWTPESKTIPRRRRGQVVDALSWVLPLIASVAGIYSAILALVARSTASSSKPEEVVLAVAASIGVILAWILLQIGFAQIYETAYNSSAEEALDFPKQSDPTLIDFLYFSFTVGTSFATSDATVGTQRVRLIVLTHSVVSFFYNALVVAVAFQVLQQAVVV